MKQPTTVPRVQGRTRWRRFMLLFSPALGAVVLLGVLVVNGVAALNLSVSGIPFKLSASSLQGSDYVQYAQPDVTSNSSASALVGLLETENSITPAGSPGTAGTIADTWTVLNNATINDLNQSVCAPLTGTPFAGLGALEVTIAANPATTSGQLTVQAPALAASSAVFSNIVIGEDAAAALSHYGYPNPPYSNALGALPAGDFAQAADSVTINGLTQIAVGTEAGSFTLNNLKLSASFVGSC